MHFADLAFVGWFGTTLGLALHGSGVAELRALLADARDDEDGFSRRLVARRPAAGELVADYDNSQAAFYRLARALEQILSRSRPDLDA